MVVKCNVSHEEGISKISSVDISIVQKKDNYTLLQQSPMEKLDELSGSARSSGLDQTEINKSISIDILNQLPEIRGTIEPIQKREDDPFWTINLSAFKYDLEDSDKNLIWVIENVSESLLNIELDGDNLKFSLVPDAFGSNELELILKDSDNGKDEIRFWVFVAPVNDPPKIKPSIPDQEQLEDSKPWFINLTEFGFDIEDTSNNKSLTWSVLWVNESLINIEILSSQSKPILKITPKQDAYGSNLIKIKAEDSEGDFAAQNIMITIKSLNDPPSWKTFPKLKIHNSDNPSHDFISCTIDLNGKLNITIQNSTFIGSGLIMVSAYDGTTTVFKTVNLSIQLTNYKVHLAAPENSSIITTIRPTLHWYLDKPPWLEGLLFDVYLDQDFNLVRDHADSVRKAHNQTETWFKSYYELKNDKIYYWTVVAKYYDENNEVFFGKTIEEAHNFRIDVDSGNHQPISILLSPKSSEVINKQEVNLSWLGFDPDSDYPITYELYLSTNKAEVINHQLEAKIILRVPTESYFEFTGLNDNEIYYWTVLPVAKGQKGKCLTDFDTFAVDLFNTKPITTLVLPRDKIIVSKPPILYWDYIDPDPFEELYFDIYLDINRSLIEDFNPQTRIATVKDTTNYYLQGLIPDIEYYWTIISYDKEGPGICECGIWSFFINESKTNHPPIASLIEPKNKGSFSKETITLKWNSTDLENDKILYTIYLSDNFNSISRLDPKSKFAVISDNSFDVNLTKGKTYYWTVIPEDGKVSGLCLSEVWSFEIGHQKGSSSEEIIESNQTIRNLQVLFLILIIISIIGLSIWIVKKRKKEYQINKILKGEPDEKLIEDMKTKILSTGTLRALHTLDMDKEKEDAETDLIESDQKTISSSDRDGEIDGLGNGIDNGLDNELDTGEYKEESRGDEKEMELEKVLDKDLDKRTLREKRALSKLDSDDTSHLKVKPKPYINGEYQYTVEKSRYRPLAKKHAERVKHAIPYASGTKKQNNIFSKPDIKLAKPLSKKIMSEKAIKASTLPITRQCPKCGSFKVKTFKNNINKCLECKLKF
jgi:hypothetical protein